MLFYRKITFNSSETIFNAFLLSSFLMHFYDEAMFNVFLFHRKVISNLFYDKIIHSDEFL